jgi:hypothetical protein
MDFKSFSDLVNANPKMRLVFVGTKGGEISPYNLVRTVVKADKVIINLSPVAKKTYEVCEHVAKLLATVTEADALEVSVNVDGKVFALVSAKTGEKYVNAKVS